MIMCVWGTETEAGTSMEDVDKSKRFHDMHLRGKRSLAAWKAAGSWVRLAGCSAPSRARSLTRIFVGESSGCFHFAAILKKKNEEARSGDWRQWAARSPRSDINTLVGGLFLQGPFVQFCHPLSCFQCALGRAMFRWSVDELKEGARLR